MVNKTHWTGGEHTPFHATFGIASNGLMGLKPLPLLCSPVESRIKDDRSSTSRHTLSRRQRSGKKRSGGKGGKGGTGSKGRGVRGRVVSKASPTFSGRLLRTTKAAQAQRCVALDDKEETERQRESERQRETARGRERKTEEAKLVSGLDARTYFIVSFFLFYLTISALSSLFLFPLFIFLFLFLFNLHGSGGSRRPKRHERRRTRKRRRSTGCYAGPVRRGIIWVIC